MKLTGSLKIVLVYAVFAVLWIVLSDRLVEVLFNTPNDIAWISTLKGLLFVVVTTLLLYGLVRWLVGQINAAHQRELNHRLAAERIIKASEQRFHDIAAVSADWIWEVDATGHYTYISDSVERLLGYTPAEILGKTAFDLMPPEEAQRVRVIFTEMAARRESFRDLGNLNQCKNGEICYVLSYGVPMLDAEGQFLGYRGLDRDVTQLRQAQAHAAQLTADLRTTLQAIPDLLFELDAQGRYIKVEATAPSLLAAPADQLLQHTVMEMLPAEAAQSVMAGLAQAAQTGSDYGRIILLPLATGTHYFELSVARKTRATDALDAPQHFIVLSRDITARKMAEDELRRNNEELHRFNRASVGRELDMVKLKQQINALSKELGRPPPYSLAFLKDDAGRVL